MNEYGVKLIEQKTANARAESKARSFSKLSNYTSDKQYFRNWNNFKLTPEYFLNYMKVNNGYASKYYLVKKLSDNKVYTKPEVYQGLNSLLNYFKAHPELGVCTFFIDARLMFIMPSFKDEYPDRYEHNKIWKQYFAQLKLANESKHCTSVIEAVEPKVQSVVVTEEPVEILSQKATEIGERKRGTFESLLSRVGEHLDSSSAVVKKVCKHLLAHF